MFAGRALEQTQGLPRISRPDGRAGQVYRDFYGFVRVSNFEFSDRRVKKKKHTYNIYDFIQGLEPL